MRLWVPTGKRVATLCSFTAVFATGPLTSPAFHPLQLGASIATTSEGATKGDKAQTQEQEALLCKHDWGQDEVEHIIMWFDLRKFQGVSGDS